jgi:hypothetical protein
LKPCFYIFDEIPKNGRGNKGSIKRSSPGGLQGFETRRNIGLDYAEEKCQYVVWIVMQPEIFVRPFLLAEAWPLSPFDYIEGGEIYPKD